MREEILKKFLRTRFAGSGTLCTSGLWWQFSYRTSTVCCLPFEILWFDAGLFDGGVCTGPLDPGHIAETCVAVHPRELLADDAEAGQSIPADEH